MAAQVQIKATFTSAAGSVAKSVIFDRIIIGGWTGRDKAAVQHHIDELVAIGVAPPAKTPTFYRVSVGCLTTAGCIDTIGNGSSGEVEYTLIRHEGVLWVGAGSDHTDRAFEKYGVTLAKQMCAKPIAAEFWPLHEVQAHWDQIRMQSYVLDAGKEVLYQDGVLGGLLSPDELLGCLAAEGDALSEGTFLFGGTTAAIGGVRFSDRFRFALVDPVLKRSLEGAYSVLTLPIHG